MTAPGRPRRRHKARSGPLTAAGQAMADRRIALGLTQAELADLAGTGISSVRSLETGETTVTLTIALRIVDALGFAAGIGPSPALRHRGNDVVLLTEANR